MGGRSRLTSSTGDDGSNGDEDVGSVDDDSVFVFSDSFALVGRMQCDLQSTLSDQLVLPVPVLSLQ